MLKRLLAMLRRLIGLPETREVLRLGGPSEEGRAQDVTHEQIRRKGPLKPQALRNIIRDERLMPKAP